MLPVQTPRLHLRPFQRSDMEPMLPLIGDFDIANNTSRIPHPYTMADAEAFLTMLERDPEKPILAVTLDNAVIGAVGLELEPLHDRAELGYWIGRPYWNKGYATEAARAMIALGFTRLALNKIVAHHFTRNPASGRVLEKAGLLKEGLLRHHFKRFNKYEDAVAHGLTRQVWEVRCAQP